MKYCTRCVMPDTKPDLSFDSEGVCDACRSQDKKDTGIDWNARRRELGEVLERYRSKDGSNYDCIVPVSGGKDSTYQVHVIKNEFGLNPLCVTFEPTLPSELGKRNLYNLRKMGVDVISFEKNPAVYKKLGREAFYRVGDHDWPNHVGIFTVPIRVAVAYRIPLVIWGENSQLEYGGPAAASQGNALDRRWLEEFGGLLGNRIEDMQGNGISKKDLLPYVYPTDEELRDVGVTGIFLGYYLKWNAREQVEVVKKQGFGIKDDPVEGTYVDYENLDCDLVSIHDYLKYVKFGFGRATDHACLDIRNKRMKRDEALRIIKKYDGKLFKKRVKQFIEFYEMTEEEFFRVVDSFTNKAVFKTDGNGKIVRDSEGNLINLMLDEELKRCGVE
ncbi:MAG: N-acetyl sugar amidotransferase [Candidatus Micrarchaeota archaeon]